MIDALEFGVLVVLTVHGILSSSPRTLRQPEAFARFFEGRNLRVSLLIGCGVLVGCCTVAMLLHEPFPRGHDEFSYLLMGDTLAHGRLVNASPPLPEFFDTFHVISQPVYVSKYFPAQGLFLAIGQRLTLHPSVGLWLGSALACAATYWMLVGWIEQNWALLGALVWTLQYGIFSYWSQSYWGGMAAALGGALAFGAARRLWDEFSWMHSISLGVGVVILVNSRPVEGILALLPVGLLFLQRLWRDRRWMSSGLVKDFAVPTGLVLALGALLTCTYNRAITGSPWKPPHLLHEEQYQETPELGFLPMHSKRTYTSPWLQYWYEVREMGTYKALHDPKQLPRGTARKLATWWAFYCGILLTPCLVVPGLLRGGRMRVLQTILLIALPALWFFSDPTSTVLRGIFDVLAFSQIVVLWIVFDEFWPRLAIATITLLVVEALFVKLFFPHYFAPAACLVLYLQVEGLRRMWHWAKSLPVGISNLPRKERRKLERKSGRETRTLYPLRGFVYLLPVACLLSLAFRVEARRAGWSEDPHGPDRQALLMNDWSLRRAELQKWLDQQSGLQLVFVSYTARHNVNNEWVYNDADLPRSHVVWARDLGPEHNRLLLQAMSNRTVWWLEADKATPQLVLYREHPAPPLPYWLEHSPSSAEADSSSN